MAKAAFGKSTAKKRKVSDCPYLIVAGFDFGTTYSGYAFSFLDDSLKVITNQSWIAGSEKLISLKTPTCVLLNPNKEFDSFGFAAENKFTSLAEDDKHHGWYFFRRFKMMLHKNEELSRNTTIEDISGKSMNAMTIFAMCIRFLKNHFISALEKQVTSIQETDVLYVITVPAIWDDRAKQFMREASIEAGIDTTRLKMALEPEAASIWCQVVTTDAKMVLSAAGTQYMVVDLGGGTADISVHEKKSDGSLREIHKASGGVWGGNAVDNNYIHMLTELFGAQVIDRFKSEQMADYFDILREFETKKRTITSTTEGLITFRVSATLKEIYEESGVKMKDRITSFGFGDKIKFTGDKLRIDASIVMRWFQSPIKSLICHVTKLLSEPKMKEVAVVVLVGGFGESELVQEELKTSIQNKKLIIPNEAGLAVLKGAVRFGHIPDVVSSRIMRYTYGMSTYEPFDPKIHPEYKMKIVNGAKECDDVFDAFVRSGDEITLKQNIKRSYIPTDLNITGIEFYSSDEKIPTFTTDQGCKKIGEFQIEHNEGKTFDDKTFEAIFVFSDTEVFVSIKILKTGRKFHAVLDCL